MLLGTLGARLLGKMSAGKGVTRAGEGTVRVGYGSKISSFNEKKIPPHSLTSFEIQIYYQNEPRFNGVYSRDNLPDITNIYITYITNLDECSDIGSHWIALYVNFKTVPYFDSFGVEHISKEIKKFINSKNIIVNFFRIQAYDSTMSGYFCIGFIDFMFKDNSLTDFTNLFSPNNFKKMTI